jgi:NitT/TauT family transport system substrate-binding protein
VAKATFDRIGCSNTPTFAQQLDPNSPYSLTAMNGGLTKKMTIATQVLFESGSIPARLSMEAISEAIDPSYVRQFVEERKQ